jgi:hypothetical protein
VLPSSSATSRIAPATILRRFVTAFSQPATDNAVAARTVPCQVRKSFAVISAPLISRRYALMSSLRTSCQRRPVQ